MEAWTRNACPHNAKETFEVWTLKKMFLISWADSVPNYQGLRITHRQRYTPLKGQQFLSW